MSQERIKRTTSLNTGKAYECSDVEATIAIFETFSQQIDMLNI